MLSPEIRPEHICEIVFGIGRLPEKEVGETLLAACPYDEVRVWNTGQVQPRSYPFRIDILRRKRA